MKKKVKDLTDEEVFMICSRFDYCSDLCSMRASNGECMWHREARGYDNIEIEIPEVKQL